jgi:hypothetical protein
MGIYTVLCMRGRAHSSRWYHLYLLPRSCRPRIDRISSQVKVKGHPEKETGRISTCNPKPSSICRLFLCFFVWNCRPEGKRRAQGKNTKASRWGFLDATYSPKPVLRTRPSNALYFYKPLDLIGPHNTALPLLGPVLLGSWPCSCCELLAMAQTSHARPPKQTPSTRDLPTRHDT